MDIKDLYINISINYRHNKKISELIALKNKCNSINSMELAENIMNLQNRT
jgi:hypothetical protein